MELAELIRKYALKNADDYGSADFKTIVGKVIGENPQYKKDIKEIVELAKMVCSEINLMDKEAIKDELKKYEFAGKTKHEERKWEVANAEYGNIITRFSPEPNGYLHIGHAKALFINYKIANTYNGKFIIKFDDTNPVNCTQKFVDEILADVKWLGINADEIKYTSDIIEKIFSIAKKMISNKSVYICICKPEEIKKNRNDGIECACRNRDANENLDLWKRMNKDMKEGNAIVRFKGDMKSKNTAMRDPALFRIIDARHYRLGDKYRVWPTYDFENPVGDSLFGVTHVLRSKEFELRAELHNAILKAAELREITYQEFARLSIDGYPVSKRLIRPYIDNGIFTGYDDPRLVTIAALKRRGIPKEAVEQFSLSFGLSKLDIKTDLKKLIAETRKHYDSIAKRYFAVANPKMMRIGGLGSGKLMIKMHPTKDMGEREVAYSEKLLISDTDFNAFSEGDIVRLKELKNVGIIKIDHENGGCEAKLSDEQQLEKKSKKIQWVDAQNYIDGILWVLDRPFINGRENKNSLKKIKIACEKSTDQVSEREVIQFERIGFCILDNKEKKRYIKID